MFALAVLSTLAMACFIVAAGSAQSQGVTWFFYCLTFAAGIGAGIGWSSL
jgi:hypothetical protein